MDRRPGTSPPTPATQRDAQANAPAVRVLQITDCHLTPVRGQTVQGIDPEQSLAAVTAAVLDSGQGFDLVLLTGDLADQPAPAAYRRLRELLRPLYHQAPCYCLPGNHDDPETMRRFLSDGDVRMESRITLDHWQILCLDSRVPGEPGGFLRAGEIERLQQTMTQQPDQHILVAVHHHPIPSGSQWMDTMIVANGKRLSETLEGFPGRTRVVVFGHIHQSLDLSSRGVRYLAAPSTCCQFKPDSRTFELDARPPGFRWIELYPNGDLITKIVYLRAGRSV